MRTSSELRHKPRPPTFRRKLAFASWKWADATYVIMGQCIGQNGNNVEAALKGSRKWGCEKSMENHVINCSTKVWLLPNSQHLFFNTSNLVNSLYQYLDTTSEQLGNRQGCLSADEHSWIVSCRARWSSTPETVLALVLFPVSGRGASEATGRMPWRTAAVLESRVNQHPNLSPPQGNNKCVFISSCTLDGLWSSLSHSFFWLPKQYL